MKYFHEITDKEYKEMLKKRHDYKWLQKNYNRPKWCIMHAALISDGCWALLNRDIKEVKDCEGCDYLKVYKPDFKFTEWIGVNYIRLKDVWIHRYSDQRDRRNWKTTEELYDKWIEFTPKINIPKL
jgi:hypothetical protein